LPCVCIIRSDHFIFLYVFKRAEYNTDPSERGTKFAWLIPTRGHSWFGKAANPDYVWSYFFHGFDDPARAYDFWFLISISDETCRKSKGFTIDGKVFTNFSMSHWREFQSTEIEMVILGTLKGISIHRDRDGYSRQVF